jgi:hypothetical protein
MANDMKIFLELAAKTDKFRQGMQQGEKALDGFRQYAQKVGHAVQELTSKIGVLGTAATALSTGLVLKKLFSVTDYMPVDDALLRMRVNFKNTAEEMNSFKNQLTVLAGETGEDNGRVFQMASKLSLSYKPDDIKEIINQADRISDATKEPLETSQEALTRLMKLYKLTGKEAREAADSLIASRVDLESFDSIIQRVAMRGGSKNNFVEQLAFFRGLQGAGYDKSRIINTLNTVMEKVDENGTLLNQHGIKVFSTDAQGNKVYEKKINVLKDLDKYLQKISKTASESDIRKRFDELFGPQGLANVQALIKQIPALESGIKEMGNAAQIAEGRAGAGAETWEKQLDKIKSHLGGIKNSLSFIYDLAKKPVKFMADSPNLTKAAGYTAAGVSAVVLGALAYGNIKNILKSFGKTGVGIVEGQAIQATTGVPSVFVVNMPAGGIMPTGAPEAGAASWLAKHVPWLVAGGAALTTAVAAAAVVTTVTAADAGYDVYKGGKGDNWINDLYMQFSDYGAAIRAGMREQEIKNEIHLSVMFDKDGRVIADTGNRGADLYIDVNRGTSFGSTAPALPMGYR